MSTAIFGETWKQIGNLIFGDKPVLAMAQITLQKTTKEGGKHHPEAAEVLKNNMYMDNICNSVHSMEKARKLSEYIDEVLNGGFAIKGWLSNRPLKGNNTNENQKVETEMKLFQSPVLKSFGIHLEPPWRRLWLWSKSSQPNHTIEDSFASPGIPRHNLYSKLVGLGADSASVNSGNKSGVKTLLQAQSPWLLFQCCIAYCLELVLRDALKETYFKEVDQMLIGLYYLYHKAP